MIQDLPNGNDSELDRNQQEDYVVGGEPLVEPSNATTYYTEIIDANNVAIGDHNTIIVRPHVRQSGERRINTVRISEEFQAIVESGDRESVDEETRTQISERPFDMIIVAIGDNNVINVQLNSDQMLTRDFQTSLEDQHQRNDPNNVRRFRVLLPPVSPLRNELSQLPVPGLDQRVRTVFKIMSEIVDKLYPLRDCGKWQEFGGALNTLHRKYDSHPEINCLLLLEESVTLTYQKRFKAAKKIAKESLNHVHNEANKIDGALQDVLRALANIALASIYRRLPKKKLGKVFQCLRLAMESGERLKHIGNLTIPDFVLALLDYELARFRMEFAAVKSDTKCGKREASKFLGLCIDRCRALSDNDQLYTAKQIFALISLARLSLPSVTCQFQPCPGQKMIKKQLQCARQAEKHLGEYQRIESHAEGSPVAARVKYLMTRSELSFLKTDYTGAKDYARQALEYAKKYDLELEIVPAQIHLDYISRCCPSITAQDKFQRVKNLSSSYSSSTTTDSDQKYNVRVSQRAT